MTVLAGSPFAPDAASDWWNFAVNVLIGVATLATLVLALVQTRIALAEAKQATKLANESMARERQRDQRESMREHQTFVDDLRKRAARQALAVWVPTAWDRSNGEDWFQLVMRNDSSDVLRDVVLRWKAPSGETLTWKQPMWSANKGARVGRSQPASKYGIKGTPQLKVEVEFTDVYSDRWRLRTDKTVRLVDQRHFVLDSSDDPLPNDDA